MASILNIVRRTSPDFQATGTDQPRYTATWLVEVNDYIPGGQVIFLAQNSVSTNRVPKEGESLRWVSGSSGTYRDSGAFALDFNAVLAEPPVDFPHLWKITVGWRAPTPGKDEQPGSAGIQPTARPPEFSIQYHTTSEEITEAWNVIGIGSGFITRDAFTKGPITTSAAERVHGFYKDRLKAVIVAQRNVSTPAVALNLNNTFEDTINNSIWSTPYIQVAKHHARFLRAETGDQIREGAFVFWRMRVSVEIGSKPFYINLPNVGTQFWDGNDVKKARDADGVLQEIFLDQAGELFLNDTPITIPYVVHQEKAYGTLPF